MDLEPIFKGVLPAIAAALLFVSLGGARWVSLAAAAGIYVAYVLLQRWPSVPTALWHAPNGVEWLLWAVIAAALLSLLEHLGLWKGKLAVGSAVGLGVFGTWLVLNKVAQHWSGGEVLLYTGGGAIAVAVLTLGMRRLLQHARPGPFSAIAVLVILTIDASVLTMGGSALLGQLCGALAAAVGAGLVTLFWRKPFALSGADGTWLGIAHGLFLLAGVHLSYLSWTMATLAAASIVLLLLLGEKQKSGK